MDIRRRVVTEVYGKKQVGSSSGDGGAEVKRNRLAEHLYETALKDESHMPVRKATKPKTGYHIPSRPNFLVCYLCGQQFGTASLSIHQPQCYVKKLVEWERSDPERRGPKPKHPSDPTVNIADKIVGMSPQAVDQFNDMQFANFQQGLVPCENCGRTFLPDRLQVHLKSCKPGSGSKPSPASRASKDSPSATEQAEEAPIRPAKARSALPPKGMREPPQPELVECPKCQRKFNPKSAEKHIPNCHAKPLPPKPVAIPGPTPSVEPPAPPTRAKVVVVAKGGVAASHDGVVLQRQNSGKDLAKSGEGLGSSFNILSITSPAVVSDAAAAMTRQNSFPIQQVNSQSAIPTNGTSSSFRHFHSSAPAAIPPPGVGSVVSADVAAQMRVPIPPPAPPKTVTIADPTSSTNDAGAGVGGPLASPTTSASKFVDMWQRKRSDGGIITEEPPLPLPRAPKFCMECGGKLANNPKFCPQCGFKIQTVG